MKILVLNSGSSSIKYKVYDKDTLEDLASGIKEEVQDHSEGIERILKKLTTDNLINDPKDIFCVGHRVVHGGDFFDKPTLINDEVISKIEKLCELAPLHNPANLLGIKAVEKTLVGIPQVAVFDTAFHQSIPSRASFYPIPYEYYEKFHIRKYGFHGTSHEYVAKEAAKELKKDLTQCNLITLHLGNGASVCAIKDGKSIDTSMGFTPLEGLMMGTRCGDIDPSVVFYLEDKLECSRSEIDTILNKKSGFKGLCGTNDLREVIRLANAGETHAKLAIEIFIYRIKKYIGSYLMILGSVDAIVLTGGIGEHSELVQNEIYKATDKFELEHLVIPTNEELSIAIQVKEIVSC
jgi:acetate kinase